MISSIRVTTENIEVLKMVKIVSYKLSWPEEFREISNVLRQGLGKMAIRIDHIGSTSVPGLAAKDIIDIQITVASFSDPIDLAMTKLGYKQPEGVWIDHCPLGSEYMETDWAKLFFNAPPEQRLTNTHVRVQGMANQRYALLFRDYLRVHSASARSYAELKRRLIENISDPKMYPDVKDPAVDLIYWAAEAWATMTEWQPGPTDE